MAICLSGVLSRHMCDCCRTAPEMYKKCTCSAATCRCRWPCFVVTRVSVLLMLFILLTSACTSAVMQYDSNQSNLYNQHLAQLLLHGKDSNDLQSGRGTVEWRGITEDGSQPIHESRSASK